MGTGCWEVCSSLSLPYWTSLDGPTTFLVLVCVSRFSFPPIWGQLILVKKQMSVTISSCMFI